VLIRPNPGGGLTCARATLDSPHGEIVSAWQLTETSFELQVTVPPNAYATVYLPAKSLSQVAESSQPMGEVAGVTSARVQDNVVVVELGAGRYEFTSLGLNLAQAMEGVRHVAGRLDIYCSLGDLLADERSKAILAKYVDRDILEAPWIRRAMDQPVEALARFAPHLLTPERLEALQQELVGL
jgi:hypothetical protein